MKLHPRIHPWQVVLRSYIHQNTMKSVSFWPQNPETHPWHHPARRPPHLPQRFRNIEGHKVASTSAPTHQSFSDSPAKRIPVYRRNIAVA